MLERVSPGPRSMRRARHWATELAIVVAYRDKLERDRRIFGDCVVEVDPLELTPATVATPAPASH